MSLDQEYVKSRLCYDPKSGELRWKAKTDSSNRSVAWNKKYEGKIAGCGLSGRRVINICGRPYEASRIIWLIVHGTWPAQDIDHANRNPLDNRLENLRLATRSQNCANKGARSDNSSGFKGVSYHKQSGKWRAKIKHFGVENSLGLYDSPAEAGDAYRVAAQQIHGKFACVESCP